VKKALVAYSFIAILIISFVCPSFAAEQSTIEKLAALPEDKIDIGIVSLTLAKEFYPDLDIEAYSAQIDAMAKNVKLLTRYSTDPDFRIRALNSYLYKVEGIQYDLTDPLGKKPENRYLNGILDTKKGSCVTMPLLYLAIAQRLGYPIYPVATPDHLFLRYEDPKLKMKNIEATGGGGFNPEGKYKADFRISDKAIENGVYLRTMTYRELLADLIAQNGIEYGINGDMLRATKYLEVAVKLNPRCAEIYDNLGRAYLYLSRRTGGVFAETYSIQSEIAFRKAADLGIVRLSAENRAEYVKNVRKKRAKEELRKLNGGLR
jgi:regulator of sirC expression with transglutaminase-like and TPR domain